MENKSKHVFIKVVDQGGVAEQLNLLGFQYMFKEHNGSSVVLLYESSDELIQVLRRGKLDAEFALGNTLSF